MVRIAGSGLVSGEAGAVSIESELASVVVFRGSEWSRLESTTWLLLLFLLLLSCACLEALCFPLLGGSRLTGCHAFLVVIDF